MNQTFTINADRVSIRNIDNRRARRRRPTESLQSRCDVLDRVPEPVELSGDRDVVTRPSLSQDGDVIDGRLSESTDDVHVSHAHSTSSSSGSPAVPVSGPGITTPRLEEPSAAPAADAPVGAALAERISRVAPTLYYQDRLVTLYHGDCLNDPSLWAHADVMVTDPPYGLQALAGAYGFASSKRGSVTIANDLDTTIRDEVLRIWGDKPVAVFGTPRLPEPPGGWSDRLVWDKAQLGLNGGPWRYAHETVFVRGPGWSRVSDASSSILRHSSAANRRHVAKHIHSKPEALLAELLSSAPEGLLVDPFAGGGSTVAAARALGRPIVAFELEEQYCSEIVDRITSRLDLFASDEETV